VWTPKLTSLQGAKPSELVIEACRRNNTELLSSVIEECESPEAAAKLLNESRSVLGNYAYHEAAANGHCKQEPRRVASGGYSWRVNKVVKLLILLQTR
jgi:hypothetical protein